jgi:hypothetical protein
MWTVTVYEDGEASVARFGYTELDLAQAWYDQVVADGWADRAVLADAITGNDLCDTDFPDFQG